MRILFFILFLVVSLPSHARSISGIPQIIDGDTIIIKQEIIRLEGIDAPEAGQKCNRKGGGKWPCGKSSIQALKRVHGEIVISFIKQQSSHWQIVFSLKRHNPRFGCPRIAEL